MGLKVQQVPALSKVAGGHMQPCVENANQSDLTALRSCMRAEYVEPAMSPGEAVLPLLRFIVAASCSKAS